MSDNPHFIPNLGVIVPDHTTPASTAIVFILGLKCDVIFTRWPQQRQFSDCQGEEAHYEIHRVSHKGDELDIEALDHQVYDKILKAISPQLEKELKI